MSNPEIQTMIEWERGDDPLLSRNRGQSPRFYELIVTKLDSGLDAQRIYQDLVRDHDFPGKYYSVRRYVQKLGQRVADPVRRIESVPGEELQVDYGMGARAMLQSRRQKHQRAESMPTAGARGLVVESLPKGKCLLPLSTIR